MASRLRSYSELVSLKTFEERFEYLFLAGSVGNTTFGWERYFSQRLYHTKEWKAIRNKIILRDDGCDLAVPDRVIIGRPIIHHMNPVTMKDIESHSPFIYDPEYLILLSHETHNAIHYGREKRPISDVSFERHKNDTAPWKKVERR